MKVECVLTLLNELHGDKYILVDYSKGGMLRLKSVYTIYGISLWHNTLNYLIVPKEGARPDWYPAELFLVVDELLHFETYFKYFGKDDSRGVNALWGYREMVAEPSHYVNLIERDETAIKIFLKRKQEIDDLINHAG
jgi:hypothetical protein